MWLCRRPCALIQDLGRRQLEYELKIFIIDVEESSFGYDLIIGDLVNRGLSNLREDPLISETCPWRRGSGLRQAFPSAQVNSPAVACPVLARQVTLRQ